MNVLLFVPAVLLVLSVCLTVFLFKRGRTARQALAIQLLSLVVIAAVSCTLPTAVKAETAPADTTAVNTEATKAETAADNGAAALNGVGKSKAAAEHKHAENKRNYFFHVQIVLSRKSIYCSICKLRLC